MNTTKICISIKGETIDDVKQKIGAAAGNADLIEIRFDGIDEKELFAKRNGKVNTVSSLIDRFPEIAFIVTFRSREQGGFQNYPDTSRDEFWNWDFSSDYIDCELDIADRDFGTKAKKKIISIHNFRDSEMDFEAVLARAGECRADVLKLAITSVDATDGIAVWNFAKNLKTENDLEVIPIAMGDCGKWTRILAPQISTPLIYASGTRNETVAPGQVSAEDLNDVFRVKEIDGETEVYGLVAGSTAYSMSPYMHNSAFSESGLNAVYVPFEVRNLADFVKRMVRPESREIELNICGFSVTNPFKQEIIEQLDFLDTAADRIGAVNTVKIIDKQLVGFNTDADGFATPLEAFFKDISGKRFAIFGSGGAARACVYALKTRGAEASIFARNVERAGLLANDFGCHSYGIEEFSRFSGEFDAAVNSTPCGTAGMLENESVLLIEEMKTLQLIYDLVYNPIDTLLLREAKKAGIPTIGGLEMLVEQGKRQFELWTGRDAPAETMRHAALIKLHA